MKKVFIIILLMLILLPSANGLAYADIDFNTSAKSMIIIEQNTKRILYSKNIDEKLPMASTTKIVTALTVLENCENLDEEFVIDNRAVGITGTSIYLTKGEKFTARELLYGMMLVSGNDAATALALHVSNSIEEFAMLMKKTAISAGAKNSNFTNPHGLDENEHYTTAHDLALITAKALENPIFSEIVKTKSYKIRGNDKVEFRYLKNKNKLLNWHNWATGVKTGYTSKAGRCFVGSGTQNNLSLICVVLNDGPMFEDCSTALLQCYETYEYMEVLKPYNYIRKVNVNDGKEDSLKVYTRRGFYYPLTMQEFLELEYEYILPETLQAPIDKEECVGELVISLYNQELFRENIYSMEAIKSINVFDYLKEIISQWNKKP